MNSEDQPAPASRWPSCFNDMTFCLFVFMLFVMFAGTPDLHDALVRWVMAQGAPVEPAAGGVVTGEDAE